MSDAARIGILGGTFDPPHNAHLAIGRAAREFADLDRVLFMVAATPPHKRNDVYADAETRYEMVRLAVADEPGLEASRLELDREGPSYTADTVRVLREQNPDAELYLIIGYDSLVDFPGWRDPESILNEAKLLAVPRPGEPEPLPAKMRGRYELLPFEKTNVSSTEIRRRIARGEALDGLAPPEVVAYIKRKELYRDAGDH